MDALLALTNIAIILLLGALCSVMAKKIRISDVLVLLVLGLLLGRIAYKGQSLFVFDNSFLVGVGVLALVMVAFDNTSRFRIKEHSAYSPQAFKVLGLFALFSILLLPLFIVKLFFIDAGTLNILLALVFTIVILGTDLDAVLAMLQDSAGERAKKVLGFLHTEAVISTVLVVLIPFIIIDIIKNFTLWQEGVVSSLVAQVPLLLFQLIIGVGAGVIIGIIVLKTMQKVYHEHFSPIGLLSATLLSYLLAEHLGGNGALAVASLGFLFGRVYVKEKPKLQEFSYMLSNSLEILVFVLLGLVIIIPLTKDFIINSLVIFALMLLCRLTAVFIALKKDYSAREKFFVAFNMPKGIALAAIIFMLALYNDSNLNTILQLILAVTIYSLVLSTLVDKLPWKFAPEKIEKSEKARVAKPKKTNKPKKKA